MTTTPTPPNPTSTSLLLRLKTQDEAAWERFVAVYGPLVMHWIRRWFEHRNLTPSQAEDIAQEVFATVYRYVSGFERARTGSFRKWLRRITDSRTADCYEKQGRAEPTLSETQIDALHKILDPNDSFSDDNDADEESPDERRILLQTIVRTIKTDCEEKTWRAFEMMAVEGYTAAEAGERLGMTANNVRQAKNRILRRINDEFGDMLD